LAAIFGRLCAIVHTAAGGLDVHGFRFFLSPQGFLSRDESRLKNVTALPLCRRRSSSLKTIAYFFHASPTGRALGFLRMMPGLCLALINWHRN